MARWRVSATMHGKRITTEKYWLKKQYAQAYADETNLFRPGSRARVVKG